MQDFLFTKRAAFGIVGVALFVGAALNTTLAVSYPALLPFHAQWIMASLLWLGLLALIRLSS